MQQDWVTVSYTIDRLLSGRFGLVNRPDDVPGAIIYAAGFLGTRRSPGDLTKALWYAGRAATMVRNRPIVFAKLQGMRARLLRERGEPGDLSRAVSLQTECVELTPADDEELVPRARSLVELLLLLHGATGQTECLDRAEQLCRRLPEVADRCGAQVRQAQIAAESS